MARFTAVAVAMLVVLAAGVWLFWFGAGLVVVTPGVQTELRMKRLGEAVLGFARKQDRLPGSLGELPADPVDGKPYATADLWGREIRYEARPDGVVVLSSFGADGLPGGVGDAADVVWRRAMRDPASGAWAAEPIEIEVDGRATTRVLGGTTGPAGPTTLP